MGQRLERLPTLALKNLDPLMLGDLAAVALGDDTWRERFTSDAEPPPLVEVDGDSGNFLLEIPEVLVAVIAAWTDVELARVAGAWSQTEYNEWSTEDCVQVVTDLRALAVRGRKEGKRLYYWM